MIVWNTSTKKIEGMYDGRVSEFAPNERKTMFNPDVFNHLFYKLKRYGLVLIDEEKNTPENEKKALLEGLKSRLKTMNFVIASFQTMNKDRESHKMAIDSPSEYVIECVEEKELILERIKEIEGDRLRKVAAALDNSKIKEAAQLIEDSQVVVENQGSVETKLGPKRPGRKRVFVPSSSNP